MWDALTSIAVSTSVKLLNKLEYRNGIPRVKRMAISYLIRTLHSILQAVLNIIGWLIKSHQDPHLPIIL
jgi:hypothetical protein